MDAHRRVSHYEKSEDKNDFTLHPEDLDYQVEYELPRLTPEAVDSIFNDLEAVEKKNGLNGGARNGDVHEFMSRLIESANKGIIVEYDPNSHEPKSKLEIDSSRETLTQTDFVKDDASPEIIETTSTVSLRDFDNRSEFKR